MGIYYSPTAIIGTDFTLKYLRPVMEITSDKLEINCSSIQKFLLRKVGLVYVLNMCELLDICAMVF